MTRYTQSSEMIFDQMGGLLTRSEAARFLGIRPQTLSAWASNGRYGLKYIKVGRRVMYRLGDLEDFLQSRTVSNTGELNND